MNRTPKERGAAVRMLLAASLLMFLLLPLYACSMPSPLPAAERFFTYWEEGNWASMYGMLTNDAQREITLEEFVALYTDAQTAMSAPALRIEAALAPAETDGKAHWVQYAAFYKIAGYSQELSFQNELHLVREEAAWRVDWSFGSFMPGFEKGDRLRLLRRGATRGEILTADGHALAVNSACQTVFVRPEMVENADALCARLAPVLGMGERQIRDALESDEAKRDGYAVIKTYLPDTLPEDVGQELLEIEGVGIDSKALRPIRYYPNGSTLAHLLGYTGLLSEDELALAQADGKQYISGDRVGKLGLEATYEEQLAGKPGCDLQLIDGEGERRRVVASIAPENGLDLVLSIDLELQRKAEELLSAGLKAGQGGSVIVMDPTTGYIQAIASAPAFDPNLFSFPIAQQLWDALNAPEAGRPFYARATQGAYPPGSLIKPFTAAAALESGAVGQHYEFTGQIEDNKWAPVRSDWYYPPISRVSGYEGAINLMNAMTYSDNIYFADIALKTGEQAFEQYAARFGFGQAVPFDIPITAARLSHSGKIDNIKFLADCGYGQGEMLVTPLQITALYSALANGGSAMRPRVVASLSRMEGFRYVDVEAFEPEVWKEDLVSSQSLAALTPTLESVVRTGTGRQLRTESVGISAKTGTAEIGSDKKKEIAWIQAFINDGSANRLVCVMMEVAAGEGDVKLPIAKELLTFGRDADAEP